MRSVGEGHAVRVKGSAAKGGRSACRRGRGADKMGEAEWVKDVQ